MNEIDLSRIDLNLLVIFEAVFEAAHVGRAAAGMNLSASAVSHGLGRLRRLFNDPLFLKTPKGVAPTDRAIALAPAIKEVLAQVRTIVAEAEPFEPASSTRRFVIGAPDGVSAVFLQSLLNELELAAPGIQLGICQLLPVAGETLPAQAWSNAFKALDERAIDVAIVPSEDAPARFAKHLLYAEDFVLAVRPGHPLPAVPTIKDYCSCSHLVVSVSGDPHGFVDEVLAKSGFRRRVALTVPNFMFASTIVKDRDFICAVPRRFAELFAKQFGYETREAPLPLSTFQLNAFVPSPALKDEGISWFLDRLTEATRALRAR